ncbi:hypothetical protein [Moorella sulfitireducens (nom. illeg.)]|uniref:hypothetical protein n=1 Tax=Neomoorella sulfitireducens TaxID=2972948 RepID=UPI0021AC5441|nr:hypothetical protein [Moorella sulfitireducens]
MSSLRQFLRGAFSIVALVTLLLGAVAFLLFLAGFILGGPTATQLAVTAGGIMKWGIKLATVAVAIGIVDIYISRDHKLTLVSEEKEIDKKEKNV